jgi:hypothetical protein
MSQYLSVAGGTIRNDRWLSPLSHHADLSETFAGAPVPQQAGHDRYEQASAAEPSASPGMCLQV